MTSVVVRAPGKVVLIGEYAVLDGAEALVLAVDRYVRVEIRRRRGAESVLHARGLDLGRVLFSFSADDQLIWGHSHHQLELTRRLIEAGYTRCRASGGSWPALEIEIDTSALHAEDGQGGKLGLGSSAAVAVALDRALDEVLAGPVLSISERLHRLLPLYRAFQDGQGSGIDLAASLSGGLSSYRIVEDRARLEPLSWPGALRPVFVWTGTPASTPELVAAYRQWQQRDPLQAGPLVNDMTACAARAVAAVSANQPDQLMTCLHDYRRLLGTMSSLMGAEVLSLKHQQLAELAARYGLVYKPCGAGGGDLGMAVGNDRSASRDFAEAVVELGAHVMDLAPAASGVERICPEQRET